MKSIVELLHELKGMDELRLAERFQLSSLDVAHHRRLDFDNWLRRCVWCARDNVAAWSRSPAIDLTG